MLFRSEIKEERKLSYQEQKELNKKITKLKRDIVRLENEMEKITLKREGLNREYEIAGKQNDVGKLIEIQEHGQGRGHVLDGVDVGAGGLGQAAARVGGQGLQVAARALGVEDAEREGGLARPGDAGHRNDPAQGDGDVEVAH